MVIVTFAALALFAAGAAPAKIAPPKSAPPKSAPAPSRTPDEFVAAFTRAALSHNWTKALEFFSAENRAGQKAIGVGDAQYLAEAVGVFEVNRVKEAPSNAPPAKESHTQILDRIQKIDIRSLDTNADPMVATAVITLDDGRIYQVEWYVIRSASRADGGLAFEPASG